MKAKLTLIIDKEIINKAKLYSAKTGFSLSKIVENYLRHIVSYNDSDVFFSPKILNLKGIIELPENFDYKKRN